MEGVVVNFRGGRHNQKSHQMIVKPIGVDTKEKATALIGKKVVWKSPAGKELSGTITALHGSKGAVRVQFLIGLPGQSIGEKVRIE